MAIFELELRFSADLTTFLRSDSRDQGLVRRMLTEKTAVKDVIEACGVPHSEVDLIVAVETYGTERYAVHADGHLGRCTGCGRIYWPGTHIEKLAARLARVTGEWFYAMSRMTTSNERKRSRYSPK
jgi:uncharacterized protein with PIN domain